MSWLYILQIIKKENIYDIRNYINYNEILKYNYNKNIFLKIKNLFN